jgi:hypothetical protein
MQVWNDFVAWFNSTVGWRVFSTAILPFIAIIVAGVLAAWIGRISARKVLEQQNGELKAAAIMALIGAGRKAAIWSSLGVDEKQHVDSLISESDIRIRLLPVNGANAAADWAAHELNAMKKNSATFSFQAEQTFVDYRDRLLEWQDKPKRARRLFAFDLDQWKYDDDSASRSTPNQAPESVATPMSPERVTEALAAAPPPVAPASTDAAPPVAMTSPEPIEAAPETPVASETLAATADTGTQTVAQPVELPASHNDDDDSDVVDDPAEPYAPPVTAGTVRRATGTEKDGV